jgi:acetolactate decarboxylase
MLDSQLLHALHVQAVRHSELPVHGEPHALFQVSTIEALLHGAYDGDVTVAELSERGDLGLGTFNALDGELILADGIVYRAAEDGSVHPAELTRRSPFAVVTPFQPGVELYVGVPHDLDTLLSQLLPPSPTCTAVRIDGRFELVHLRSVPPQHHPYPPLTEVLEGQRVFAESDVCGVIVGFSFPAYSGRLNLPGSHLHFLSADLSRGGHVLSCRLAEGTIRVDHEAEIEVELPPGVELQVQAGRVGGGSGSGSGGEESDGAEELLELERDRPQRN